MTVEIIDYQDNWQAVKNAAMNTIGKDSGKYPSDDWKFRILKAEHSPIRLIEFTVRLRNVPYWVSVHLTRHKIGVEHWVRTQRTDRTGTDRNSLPQNAPVEHTMRINAQALINISRKRLCSQASDETRYTWFSIIEAIRDIEPEIAAVCVPECVYRGHCPEMQTCGFTDTAKYKMQRTLYEG